MPGVILGRMPGRAPSHSPVLRLTLRWGDAVVDSFAVRQGEASKHELHELPRGGGRLHAAWDDDAQVVVLTLEDGEVAEVAPGGRAALGGFEAQCAYDMVVPRASRPFFFDGRWLHALMIAAAFQVCAVSAFLLAPVPVRDPEPGAGLPLSDVERFLAVPAGAAPREGPATFAAMGERPEEGERPELLPPAPRHMPPRTELPTVTFRAAPDPEACALCDLGASPPDALGDLARTLGEDALDTARSEARSAGVGGLLSPRPLAEPGAGSGEVGLGRSQLGEHLKKNDERLEKKALRQKKVRPEPVPEKPVFRVDTAEVPEGEVDLDPVVREFLAERVREHKNSVRHCYETFGLAGDPKRRGRLVVEVTLLPDGHLTDVKARAEEPGLEGVAACVQQRASTWWLGDVLPDEARRLSFPFQLRPKRQAGRHDFR